jgi:Uma2 family endonuclease
MAIQPKVSIQDFEAFVALPENSDRLFELIDGEIVEKMPTEEHGFLAMFLAGEIYIYLKKNPIGRLVSEVRYQLPEDDQNSRLPDVAFTRNERLQPLVKSGAVPQMPDLVIEIKSPNDVILKMREKALYYLSNGTQLVWLVFPHKKQIEIYTADEVRVLGIDDTLDGGEVLPEFTLALKDIFTE